MRDLHENRVKFSEEKKNFFFLSSNVAALTSGARYCLARVILITIVPNKIFSYGLKQTMLETKHILMKTVYKNKK